MALNEEEKPVEETAGNPPEEIADSHSEVNEESSGEALSELEKLREELNETRDRLLRMAADFDNQKKRLQRDKDLALKYAEENLLKEILPSIDNLERAVNQDQSGDDFGSRLLEGVVLTLKGLLNSLERYEVKPVASVGERFDPNFHEALAMEASKEVPEQTVLQEFEKGYLYKDKLLRAAKVIVSKGDVN
ncbi:MAG: nucleotide exchange factor GrpE [Proteobacteria bacterium]|nr:nucleotide exchange factor GrpE [Pseudomonadota bacterium]MBU1739091.1 nucleotide exchange factor GrpE [Pseudomonadota bacterium]